MSAIAFVVLLFVGWKLAKLFDEHFIMNSRQDHYLDTCDTIDNIALIESLRMGEYEPQRRIEKLHHGRHRNRISGRRSGLEQIGPGGDGEDVLRYDEGGDVQ